jgi:hypothetical protein
MRSKYTIALLACIWFLHGYATAGPVDADAALRSLTKELLDGRIAHVDIFHIPYEVLTRTRITPELLEAQAKMKFNVELSSSVGQSLVPVIEDLKLHHIERAPDLRWGMIFWDHLGKRAHSIYLDSRYFIIGTGRRGYLDGTLIGFDGSLIRWLERNYLKQ